MAWWVYKCNSRNREYQNAYGDWDQFFATTKNGARTVVHSRSL